MRFQELAAYFDQIDRVSARNTMVEVLAELFKEVSDAEAGQVVYLIQGRVAPKFVDIEFGVADRLLIESMTVAFEVERDLVEGIFAETGDLGLTAERLTTGDGCGTSVSEVFARLREVAGAEGPGSQDRKVEGIAGLLRDLDPCSNRYFPRIPIGRLRLGVGDPTVMDALSVGRIGDKSDRRAIERAYNRTSDLGLVAREYVRDGAEAVAAACVRVGYPVRMAQAARLASGQEIVGKIGRAAVEPKLDGFRVQIHRDDTRVRIFSRNLEDMSEMFPDVSRAVVEQLSASQVIIEGEAMGLDPKTGAFLPFQSTVSRRRRHGIAEAAEAVPLQVHAFDVLFDGEEVVELPWTERRARLEALVGPGDGIKVSDVIVTDDAEELDAYFIQQVDGGFEGVMAKRLDSPYQAGQRNFNWIKYKASYSAALTDTLDCVLIGYWRGQGKRAAWGIGALLSAVWDSTDELYKSIARIGTGYSDAEWLRIREMLDGIAVDERPSNVCSDIVPDVWVEPEIVVEVLADELTQSPMHVAGRTERESGLALRFPRVQNFVRDDKESTDATTVIEVKEMYRRQNERTSSE